MLAFLDYHASIKMSYNYHNGDVTSSYRCLNCTHKKLISMILHSGCKGNSNPQNCMLTVYSRADLYNTNKVILKPIIRGKYKLDSENVWHLTFV